MQLLIWIRFRRKKKSRTATLWLVPSTAFLSRTSKCSRKRIPLEIHLDYVRGKYASMAGPAFAMIYNAITGNADALKENGEAVRLYQNLWTAKSEDEYIELYGYATGIYENAYSCDDLMQVIKLFNDDANPQSFRELTEASDVESVKERIFAK